MSRNAVTPRWTVFAGAAWAALALGHGPASAEPAVYAGGLVRIEVKEAGEQTVEVGPLVNGTDANLGAFLVVQRPGRIPPSEVRAIEVLDEEGKVIPEFRFDDDADGKIQEGEADVKDDAKHLPVGTAIGVGASVRDGKTFRLRIVLTVAAGAELSWQAARDGDTPGDAGPLVSTLAAVNRGSGIQKATLWTDTRFVDVEVAARNAERSDGVLAVVFDAPKGTTLLTVVSRTHPGTWEPGTRTFTFHAPVPAGKTLHLVITVSPPAEAVTDVLWQPAYDAARQ